MSHRFKQIVSSNYSKADGTMTYRLTALSEEGQVWEYDAFQGGWEMVPDVPVGVKGKAAVRRTVGKIPPKST